jgi:hypothetical protein
MFVVVVMLVNNHDDRLTDPLTSLAFYVCQEHPKDVLVMLVGGDHAKFGMGTPARLERLLTTLEVPVPRNRGWSGLT